MADVPRIASQKDAAAMLRVTPRRLRQMEEECQWWVPELRTSAGYDVVGVALAQWQFTAGGGKAITEEQKAELRARLLAAETIREEHLAAKAEVEAWEAMQRREKARANILPADVWAEFARELLGMVRSRLEEIPYQLSRQASPAQRSIVYVPPEKQKKDTDGAPLQKMIRKLIDDLSAWLKADPEVEEPDDA